MTQEGYHVQNNSVEVIIKNQPYTSYRNENGSIVWLYYRIVFKGHFESWDIERWDSGAISMKIYDSYPTGYCVPSSQSGNTVVAYGIAGDNATYPYFNHTIDNITVGGQIDFKMQAIIGYSTRINETDFWGVPFGEPGETPHYYIFSGQISDWSDTKTVTIGSGEVTTTEPQSSTPTPMIATSPTQSPQGSQPPQTSFLSFDWEKVAIVGLVVAVAVLGVAVAVLWRRKALK